MAEGVCGATVTTGSMLDSMSACSNSEMSEAWMAAPRAESSDGLTAEGLVEGAVTVVD